MILVMQNKQYILALCIVWVPDASLYLTTDQRKPMQFTKPRLTFSQIINMNFGFFGIQYSFGLQQTAINPLYSFLHARPEQLPLLNLAGPMTGLLIQPLIGALSDKTWHPGWGRRKPFLLVGAIGFSLCLFFFPFCSAL